MDDGRVQQNLQENDNPLGAENELRLETEQRLREWETLWENDGRYAQELEEKLNELVEAYSGRLPWATREHFKCLIKDSMLMLPDRGLAKIVEDIHIVYSAF